MFLQHDFNQFNIKGIKLSSVQRQIDHFIHGFPFMQLSRPATVGDGILRFSDEDHQYYLKFYEKNLDHLKVVKFVPASGAASRMFKHLFEFSEKYLPGVSGKELFLKDQGFNSVYYFFEHLRQIAFFDDLTAILAASGSHLEQLLQQENYGAVIEAILSPGGLNYANLPKALLKFHHYTEGSRTAAEEHLVEAAVYARDHAGIARIHFTISPEHREKFMELIERVRSTYEGRLKVKYDISFSIQKPSTDMIAVDESNQPVRNSDGSLLFRPGGHGALLENLNDIDADLVFIKNIDNIVPDRLKHETFEYKKLLGGYLLHLREAIRVILSNIQEGHLSDEDIRMAADFAREHLFQHIPEDFSSMGSVNQTEYLFKLLNRPVRICGMVKNEGEPGGGPFWVIGSNGNCTLQIVESSQIDMSNQLQRDIVEKSTHFNPVDLVCSTRDFNGNPFNLKEFVDDNTGFISLKSSGGKTLKAQELPGLWNGAMAEWITIFAEVPVITFNPVKTVNDLLRNEHLSII
jgi:hypothetical protein